MRSLSDYGHLSYDQAKHAHMTDCLKDEWEQKQKEIDAKANKVRQEESAVARKDDVLAGLLRQRDRLEETLRSTQSELRQVKRRIAERMG